MIWGNASAGHADLTIFKILAFGIVACIWTRCWSIFDNERFWIGFELQKKNLSSVVITFLHFTLQKTATYFSSSCFSPFLRTRNKVINFQDFKFHFFTFYPWFEVMLLLDTPPLLWKFWHLESLLAFGLAVDLYSKIYERLWIAFELQKKNYSSVVITFLHFIPHNTAAYFSTPRFHHFSVSETKAKINRPRIHKCMICGQKLQNFCIILAQESIIPHIVRKHFCIARTSCS